MSANKSFRYGGHDSRESFSRCLHHRKRAKHFSSASQQPANRPDNLFLFHYEYPYMKKLMKDKMCVAKMFSDTVRYIDD